MREEDRKRIEEILGEMGCPKGFTCADSGFENLCKARDFGLDHYLECLEDDTLACHFSLPFGEAHFCTCPLRVYLAKSLGK